MEKNLSLCLLEYVRLYGQEEVVEFIGPRKNHIYTYRDIFNGAAAVASFFKDISLPSGTPVMLIFTNSIDFYYAYFGVLLAGHLPSPCAGQQSSGESSKFSRRLNSILQASGSKIILTDRQMASKIDPLKSHLQVSHIQVVDQLLSKPGQPVENPPANDFPGTKISEDSTALLQFTSGSTSQPRGVEITNRHLFKQSAMIESATHMSQNKKGISWLPLYHDMGLISCMIYPFLFRFKMFLMSPELFLFKPALFYQTISKFRINACAMPNFGLAYSVSRLKETDLDQVDLSCLESIIIGAEQVQDKTMARFVRFFSRWGLKDSCLLPAYGLAECTLAVSISRHGERKNDYIDRKLLLEQGKAQTVSSRGTGRTMTIVSCGRPLPGVELRVESKTGKLLPERQVGFIKVKSESLMKGYYKDAKATLDSIQKGFFNTGDLGYLADKELYITGREKEIMIKGGKNYYPDDVENCLAELRGQAIGGIKFVGKYDIKPAKAVAFTVAEEGRGTEKIILAVELRGYNSMASALYKNEIIKHVQAMTGCRIDEVIFLPLYSLPKTTSGKKQRLNTKKLYLSQRLQGSWFSFNIIFNRINFIKTWLAFYWNHHRPL